MRSVKKDPRDLASRLDELIQQVRGHQAELQVIVQQAGGEVEKALADTFRQDFRRLGVTQRQVIADLQRFADDARKELDVLNQKRDDQKSPQDRLQTGQYNNVLKFLDAGLQRLSQSRSLTRRLQGNRAFRRWSAGLSDAKRARDQLRDPVELLGQIIADATETAELTRGLASAGAALSPTEQQQATRAHVAHAGVSPGPAGVHARSNQGTRASAGRRRTKARNLRASGSARTCARPQTVGPRSAHTTTAR